MNYWERFSNYEQRGEWVELFFMAEAAKRLFAVSKPWGVQPYDVGIEHRQTLIRVQVKSTTWRTGGGYRCQMRPKHRKTQTYSLEQVDLFAAYVIPEDAWYFIPAALLLNSTHITDVMLCPVKPPAKKASYRYECYREAWHLLKKSRTDLQRFAR